MQPRKAAESKGNPRQLLAALERREHDMSSSRSKGFWVYIARLKNGQLYVGITDDINRRTAEHVAGKPSTRTTFLSRLEELLYKEFHPDRPSALARERQLKGWTRAKKLALVGGDIATLKQLAKRRSK